MAQLAVVHVHTHNEHGHFDWGEIAQSHSHTQLGIFVSGTAYRWATLSFVAGTYHMLA